MDAEALALVVTGALLHACWNLYAKKASGGAPFVFLYGLVSLVVAAPFGLLAYAQNPAAPSAAMWLAIIASAALHLVYSLVLQKGYREADFSVVYPIARGTGPLFSVIGAIMLLGEMPSARGWAGIAAIVCGIFLIAGMTHALGRMDARLGRGLLWGGCTGLFIAAYTVVDGWAIKSLGMVPVVFYVLGLAFRTLLLAPSALRAPQALRQQWRLHRRYVLVVGLLSPLAYTLVLHAVARAPLSYVAPARELSMLIGAYLGAQLLREGNLLSRLAGTALMVLGVVLLAFA